MPQVFKKTGELNSNSEFWREKWISQRLLRIFVTENAFINSVELGIYGTFVFIKLMGLFT